MRHILTLSLAILATSPVWAADLPAMNDDEIAAMYRICLEARKPLCGLRGCIPVGDWPTGECVNIQVEAHRRAENAPKPKPPIDNTQSRIDWLNGMAGAGQ